MSRRTGNSQIPQSARARSTSRKRASQLSCQLKRAEGNTYKPALVLWNHRDGSSGANPPRLNVRALMGFKSNDSCAIQLVKQHEHLESHRKGDRIYPTHSSRRITLTHAAGEKPNCALRSSSLMRAEVATLACAQNVAGKRRLAGRRAWASRSKTECTRAALLVRNPPL